MKATAITSHTLVGVSGEPPLNRGNCFSVKADDGQEYRVVNFVYENIVALKKAGLTFPLEIELVNNRVAVIMDPRIGERWYAERFCEVCTPLALLPITQRQRHLRDIARGRRAEQGGCISTRSDAPALPFE